MDSYGESELRAVKQKLLQVCEATEQDNNYLQKNIAVLSGESNEVSERLLQLLQLQHQLSSCRLQLVRRQLLRVERGWALIEWSVMVRCRCDRHTFLHLHFLIDQSTARGDTYGSYVYKRLSVESHSDNMAPLVQLYASPSPDSSPSSNPSSTPAADPHSLYDLICEFERYCHLATQRRTIAQSFANTARGDSAWLIALRDGVQLGWDIVFDSFLAQFRHQLFKISANGDKTELPEELNRRLLELPSGGESCLQRLLSQLASDLT